MWPIQIQSEAGVIQSGDLPHINKTVSASQLVASCISGLLFFFFLEQNACERASGAPQETKSLQCRLKKIEPRQVYGSFFWRGGGGGQPSSAATHSVLLPYGGKNTHSSCQTRSDNISTR